MADDEGRDLDEAAAVAAGRPRGEWLVAPLERERDRWFLWLPVTFGSGILAYMSWPTEPSSLEMAAIALGMLALWIVGRARRGVTLVVTALLAMASGAAIAKIRTEFVAAPVLTADLRDAAVAATILQVEAQARGGIRLTLTATRIADLDATQRPRRIRVRFRTGAAGFKPGDAITFRATLAPPPTG